MSRTRVPELIERALTTSAEDVPRIAAIEELLLECQDEGERASAHRALSTIVLDQDDDDLVRQIASRDLAFYPTADTDEGLLQIALDRDDDLDVRVNLVEAFRRWKSPLLQRVVEKVSDDDELARHVPR
jgi:hypothetical protein